MGRWLRSMMAVVTATGWLTAVPPQPVVAEAPPVITLESVWNIAHRGASGSAPESTLFAFELGRRMGADFIELDIQMTGDGHLVVLHDDTVDRTTDGQGPLTRYTLKELKRLDAGSWFNRRHPKKAHPSFQHAQVPTLEEVLLSQGRRVRYCLEIKEGSSAPLLERKLLKTLQRYHLLPQKGRPSPVIIHSFSRETLQRIHRQAPEIPLVQLIHYKDAGYISHRELNRIRRYAWGIGFSYKRMDREDVRRARSHGLRIHPYTVNRKRDMRRLLSWGVDAISTNYPERLNKVLKKEIP
ncbi:glycerophosphodiester phosphodiesterase [Salinithrix halophila]|uniref:Glycerophosphodiester phosphodiesterase n=1 Tax=Salinithrix halophila TaxID=1485204 RepID=A0ABV8J9P3_9BACL